MTTEYSIQKMVSDGTLSTIALGIQYLQRNDIYIRIAGVETPQSGAANGYTWSFLDNTTLKILPVVPNGVEVVVYRRTDVDSMYNVYSQNAQFDESTIDENNQQLLYIAQEYLEQGIPGAGVDTIEFLRDDGTNTYYRIKRTDGSYSEEFSVPSAGSITKVLARESIRRSYAEAGYNLVDGSFEAGGTLVNASDVLLHEQTGKAYSGSGPFPQTVNAVASPPDGFTDRSGALLRSTLEGSGGAASVGKAGGGTVQDFLTAVAQDDGGNQIGYNAGMGGSKRNVLLRLRDRFNIADFRVDTDADWTNAFQRAASSGETVSVYLRDTMPGLYAPIVVNSPVTFLCEGGFRQPIAKAHNGPMFDVMSSGVNIGDMVFFNDEVLGPGGSLIFLNTASNPLEEIRLKNLKQSGGTCRFLLDGGANLIVDLALEDIKLQAPMANAIALTRAFAYLDMKKVAVNYVPSASKQFVGISITGNEGSNFEWCHVNHGITAATPNSYGFAFTNCKAVWMDRCQADTCGIDGFRFDNCQYVYGNQLSASLCGGDGIAIAGGADFTIGNSYFGGRRGLAYAGVAGSALVRSTALKAFLNGCNLSNGAANGFVASASTVLSGGGIFNTVTPHALAGVAKIRQVMNDAGALIDVG